MNFEPNEPNLERDNAEYMEKLHAALEDAVEYAEPTNADYEEYKRMLEKELGLIEEWES